MLLKTKFIAIIALVILLIIGMSTVVILHLQETRTKESVLKNASIINTIVHNSIRDAMKRNDRSALKRIIADIGDNPEVMSLRILSGEGTILLSNNKEEIGAKSRDFLVDGFEAVQRGAVMRDDSATSYLIIRNERQCFGCHDHRDEINGIVELSLNSAHQQRDLVSMKRLLLFTNILTMVLVSTLLSLMFSRNIIHPLRRLMATIKDVERGDWNSRVKGLGGDEIGIIGNAFNTMLNEMGTLHESGIRKERELSRIRSELESKRILEELNTQLNFKVRELESANKTVLTLSREVKGKNEALGKMVDRLKKINEVGRILTSIIETDEIIKLIVKTSADILYAEKCAIRIDRENSPSLTLSYHRGSGVEKIEELSLEFRDVYARILSSGKPLSLPKENVGGNNGNGNNDQKRTIGVPLKMKGNIVGAMLIEEKIDGSDFTEDELELLATLSGQAMVAIENAWLYEKLKFNYFSTIQSLVNALEASDRYTKGHSERVRYLSVQLAHFIGLDPREVESLEHAAILHDIGKIGVDASLLNKPGRLTHEEIQIIRSHPIIGEEIIGPIETLGGVRSTILQHHENFDGSGYPFGLIGDEIMLKARILAVADTFDAMITHRPYRRAMTVRDALDELERGAGAQFDPSLVSAFVQLMNDNEQRILAEAGYEIPIAANI